MKENETEIDDLNAKYKEKMFQIANQYLQERIKITGTKVGEEEGTFSVAEIVIRISTGLKAMDWFPVPFCRDNAKRCRELFITEV